MFGSTDNQEGVVREDFLDPKYLEGEHQTWVALFEAVLEQRVRKDANEVSQEIWNGFVLMAFVLIPRVQSW